MLRTLTNPTGQVFVALVTETDIATAGDSGTFNFERARHLKVAPQQGSRGDDGASLEMVQLRNLIHREDIKHSNDNFHVYL